MACAPTDTGADAGIGFGAVDGAAFGMSAFALPFAFTLRLTTDAAFACGAGVVSTGEATGFRAGCTETRGFGYPGAGSTATRCWDLARLLVVGPVERLAERRRWASSAR